MDKNVIMDITKFKIIIPNDLKEIQKWLRLTLRFNLVTVRKSINYFSSQPRLKSHIPNMKQSAKQGRRKK